jgi:molybdate transport system substrate-binding protein
MLHRALLIGAILAAIGLLAASITFPDATDDPTRDPNYVAPAPVAIELPTPPRGDGPEVYVYAAASTNALLTELGQIYERDVAVDITIVTAASSVLARQIVEGAPAQIFISANTEWADYLVTEGVAQAEDRAALMGNRLALVVPTTGIWGNTGDPATGGPAHNADATLAEQIAAIIDKGRLAVCETKNVPCGQYARQSLEALQLWDKADRRLAIGNNARGTLAWVERGEVPGGIVYLTDAQNSDDVQIITFIPDGLHDPIQYEAVLIDADDEASQGFAAFLQSTVAQRIIIGAGFMPAGIGAPSNGNTP